MSQPAYPCEVTAGSVEAGDETEIHRVAPAEKNHRNCSGDRFCRDGLGATGCDDHVHMTANQISYEPCQSIGSTFRPAVFERNILMISISRFAHAALECVDVVARCFG